jgi:hypothetical protein
LEKPLKEIGAIIAKPYVVFFVSFLLEVVVVLNGIVFGRLILSYGRK